MYRPHFASFSFGCRVNEAEKIALDQGLKEAGFIQDGLKPDIYLINTCAVTAKAEREARQMILTLKKKNPSLKIVATGCSATYWQKNHLWSNIPIDLLISNTDKEYTVNIIKKRLFPTLRAIKSEAASQLGFMDKFLDSGRVMVKIQDGCQRFCSYCIVPYLRGLPKSRTISEIVAQIRSWEGSMQEAVLTAINTEAYGMDTGESLITLIRQVLSGTEIPRLSFGSIHPWSITDEFLDYYATLATESRFSSFFHVPLQSGCDKTLRLMKRDYRIGDIGEKLARVKQTNPRALIATDIIVGFLEETDKDFRQTYDFLEKSAISRFHIFRFSKRQNTAAHFMAKRLREPTSTEKKDRAQALRDLGEKKFRLFLESLTGMESEALFIGKAAGGFQKAILNNQVVALIATDKSLSGSMKHVTITELKKGVPVGRLVS